MMRVCRGCGQTKPLDKLHYQYRPKNGKSYFSHECLECLKQARLAAKPAPQVVEWRTCKKCGLTQHLDTTNFIARVVGKVTYFSGDCRACRREYQRTRYNASETLQERNTLRCANWRAKNREHYNAYHRWYRAHRGVKLWKQYRISKRRNA